jgi:hypothetical protein
MLKKFFETFKIIKKIMGNNNCLSFFCCVCLKKKIEKTNELTDSEIKILKKKTKLNKETITNWHELFIVSI